jgi:hypothetical protein
MVENRPGHRSTPPTVSTRGRGPPPTFRPLETARS